MPHELPMQDVVKMVLEAEAESRQVLEDAQAEADRLTADARRRVQEMVQVMRLETAQQVDALVRDAEEKALRAKLERLNEAAALMETAVRLDARAEQALIEAILRCVTNPVDR